MAFRWLARPQNGTEAVPYGAPELTLKKPNYFRVDGVDEKAGEILIGDGNRLWVSWPSLLEKGRPSDPITATIVEANSPASAEGPQKDRQAGETALAHRQEQLLSLGRSMA